MIHEKLPISVLIMTQNEERNIKYAIESIVEDFDQIIVTDSFSTDKTVEICKQNPQVEIYQNNFAGWAEQRNWMLKNCNVKNELIFFLDADEYVDEKFIKELRNILNNGVKFSVISLPNKFIFLNKHLKHAYGHPRKKRIFKKTGLQFWGEGAREYDNVHSNIIEMKNPLIHHDRNPIFVWISKHNKNSDREANLYIEKLKNRKGAIQGKLSTKLNFKLYIRKSIWDRLPLFFRPFIYFVYRYIFRLGFLDGKAGLIYCYLHAVWYQSLIDIKIIERLKTGN